MRKKAQTGNERLLIVSNRAPFSFRRRGRKSELVRSIGGLASTLDDALRVRGGVWLAWSGNVTRTRRGHHPGIRSLFTRDDMLASGWYAGATFCQASR